MRSPVEAPNAPHPICDGHRVGDTEHIFNALAAGATGYLLKRVTREDLLAALEEVHRGGSPMSSSIARKVVQFFQSAPPPEPGIEALSQREQEVLGLLAEGYVNKEIADRLGISAPTVATYIRRIYEKLHVNSRAAAIGRFSSLLKMRGSEFRKAGTAGHFQPSND